MKTDIGDTLTCTKTGKQFVAAVDGCSVNYAMNDKGEVLSDEGVDLVERERLKTDDKFFCYVSSDGKTVGGWKGNVHGTITYSSRIGRKLWAYRVKDVYGQHWYGRGSPGMCINLRRRK